jgi:hypothetical protein
MVAVMGAVDSGGGDNRNDDFTAIFSSSTSGGMA